MADSALSFRHYRPFLPEPTQSVRTRNSPEDDEPQSLQVARFLVSQAIMLALAGVPGIYCL
jgi:hypothetical protein